MKRQIQRSVNFGSTEKNGNLILLLKLCLDCWNLCSLGWLNGAAQKFFFFFKLIWKEEYLKRRIYLKLTEFNKCLTWVYERHFGRSPERRDSLEGKRNYQDQILVNYSCHNWTFLWVGGCAFGETSNGCFLWQLEYGCGH